LRPAATTGATSLLPAHRSRVETPSRRPNYSARPIGVPTRCTRTDRGSHHHSGPSGLRQSAGACGVTPSGEPLAARGSPLGRPFVLEAATRRHGARQVGDRQATWPPSNRSNTGTRP
jgi:hypothetical protein